MSVIDGFTVHADWNRDLLFSHALSDITPYVRGMTWQWGYTAPDMLVAPPAQGVIELDNSDGAWRVGNSAAAFASVFRRGTLIRIRHSGQTLTGGAMGLFVGRIDRLEILPGEFGERIARLYLSDYSADLQASDFNPPMFITIGTGSAILVMFQRCTVPIPYDGYWWVLGASKLGAETRLYQPAQAALIFSVGETALPYLGDNIDASGNGVSQLAFAEEMCIAEMNGRFFYAAPYNRYAYFGRKLFTQRLVPETAQIIALTDAHLDPQSLYIWGEELCNVLEISVTPRGVGAAGSTLFDNTAPIALPPGATRQITARFRNPLSPDESCGATALIAPVEGTDYTANSARDGSGTNMLPFAGLSMEAQTGSALLTLFNSHPTDDLYFTRIRVRGTPLTKGAPLTVRAADAVSIQRHGTYKKTRMIASIGDVELAQRYADSNVKRYSTPRSRFAEAVLVVPESGPAFNASIATAHRLTQMVSVSDAWTDNQSPLPAYFIVGRQYAVDIPAGRVVCRLYLERANEHASWILGDPVYSVLGQTTRLAF